MVLGLLGLGLGGFVLGRCWGAVPKAKTERSRAHGVEETLASAARCLACSETLYEERAMTPREVR